MLSARTLSRLRLLVDLALVVALALVAARIILLIVSPVPAVTPQAAPTGVGVAVEARAPIAADPRLLVQLNPFSAATAAGDVSAPTAPLALVEDAPETDLNLILRGVRASSGSGVAGTAFIVTPDNRLGAFTEGEEIIPGTVTLNRVLSDRVLLDRGGEIESLKLNEDAGPGGLRVIGDTSREEANGANGQAGAVASLNGRVRDPETLLRSVTLTPELNQGQLVGFRVSPIGGAAVPAETGLRSGDVIVRINDMALASSDIQTVLSRLEGVSVLRLSVLRDAREISLRVEVGE